jgi:hypothetical protein
MRPEWGWALAALAAVIGAATGAESYARLITPFCFAATTLMARGHAWQVLEVEVTHDSGPGAVLRLTGAVRRRRDDAAPAATVEDRVQVGEVVETPLVFWTIVLLWPAADARQRLLRCLTGVPVFLALIMATTCCQLLHGMAEASALLAGDSDPLTLWQRWSRFLESGGRFVLEVGAAALTVASVRRGRRHPRAA